MRRPGIRSLAGGAAGIVAGVIGGIALTSVSAAGGAHARRAGARCRPRSACAHQAGRAGHAPVRDRLRPERRRRALRRRQAPSTCARARAGRSSSWR